MFFVSFLLAIFEDFVILLAILLTSKLTVASVVFWIAVFEAVFIASSATLVVPDFLALLRRFDCVI